MSDKNINISGVANSAIVAGGTVHGSVINNVNLENLPGKEEEKKDLLTLVSQLEILAKKLPPEKEEEAQRIVKRLQGVVTELSKTKPDKEDLQFNLESLRKAAQNVAAVAPSILDIAIEIAKRIALMVPYS